MMKALVWNIGSIKYQRAFQRVQILNRLNKFAFTALLKPFQQARYINKSRGRLQMPLMFHNYNGKIWYFENNGFNVIIKKDTEQLLSL